MRQLWTTFTKIGLPLIAIALLLLTGTVLAAGTLTIDRWVIGGGGGHSEAGSYVLDATVGQAVAGVKVDAPPGSLEIGELLTVSTVPGAARKASLGPESDGAILGKVAGPVDAETGTVPVFVILR